MIEQRGTPEASTPDAAAILEKVIVGGDLSKLSTAERMAYYSRVCESLSLNPLTQPFAYVTLRGRGLTLYALKAATDQLRKIHGVSITRLDVAYQDDLVVVTVQAVDRSGRTDTDVGVVAVGKLSGEERANAVLKSVTKAKRRVTLSICGLGMLDETEVETIPGAEVVVEQAGSASATALPPALSEKRATAPGTVAEQAARAELVAVARQVQTDDALLNADEATAEAGTEHTSPTFTEQAAAALREPDASTEPLSDDGGMSGLRAEVAALLERDGAALDLLKAKGTLLPDMTAEQLRKAQDWLLERERRNVPLSERLSRTIGAAGTPEALRTAQQAIQQAKDGKGISQTEYVGLLREVEGRRQALAAGPLTAGARQPSRAAGAQP